MKLTACTSMLDRDRGENGAHGSTTLQARRRNAARRSANDNAGRQAGNKPTPAAPGAGATTCRKTDGRMFA